MRNFSNLVKYKEIAPKVVEDKVCYQRSVVLLNLLKEFVVEQDIYRES